MDMTDTESSGSWSGLVGRGANDKEKRKMGGLKGKRKARENERETKGERTENKESKDGMKGKQRTRKPKDTKGDVGK